MRVAAPRPNTLKPLQNSNQPSQRLVVETFVNFHPATVVQQQRQSARPIPSAYRCRTSSFLSGQRRPKFPIVVVTSFSPVSLYLFTVAAGCSKMKPASEAEAGNAGVQPVKE